MPFWSLPTRFQKHRGGPLRVDRKVHISINTDPGGKQRCRGVPANSLQAAHSPRKCFEGQEKQAQVPEFQQLISCPPRLSTSLWKRSSAFLWRWRIHSYASTGLGIVSVKRHGRRPVLLHSVLQQFLFFFFLPLPSPHLLPPPIFMFPLFSFKKDWSGWHHSQKMTCFVGMFSTKCSNQTTRKQVLEPL